MLRSGFICKYVHIKVENADTRFTRRCQEGEVLAIPIAHGDGNYFTDNETLKRLEEQRQVVFRYCEADGSVTAEANPNGSIANIAGIMNEAGNVLGMMPHPERASDPGPGTYGRAKDIHFTDRRIHIPLHWPGNRILCTLTNVRGEREEITVMGNIGTTEIILIALVALVFFGSKKIPELAQGLGKGIREFRKATREIQDDD